VSMSQLNTDSRSTNVAEPAQSRPTGGRRARGRPPLMPDSSDSCSPVDLLELRATASAMTVLVGAPCRPWRTCRSRSSD
jgi:hypothetical protein